MSRRVTIVVGAVLVSLLGVGLVLLREADARRTWQRCNQAGFRFAETETELNRVSWLNRVRCDGGTCTWSTWLHDWACDVVDDGGVARQGGSG